MFTSARMLRGSSIATRHQSCVPRHLPPPTAAGLHRPSNSTHTRGSSTMSSSSTVLPHAASPLLGSRSTDPEGRPDLKGLLEHAAREHVQSQNNGRMFSWGSDKRPSALWVIEGESSSTSPSASPPTSPRHAWVFKRVSGSTVQCDFDIECRVDADGK